ncbi:MAG: pyridoxal phosphate-dependent decarboxylase family protein [Flavobacteriales bacterium]
MRKAIENLERTARMLEPDDEQRARMRDKVVQHTESFLREIYDNRAYRTEMDGLEAVRKDKLDDEPAGIDILLDIISEGIDRPGLNPASGGHLGYIPGGGLYTAALGDYIADITNRYAGVYFAGPGAVALENKLIRWMASLTGYPESASGNLTSGGSIANLIGVVTARDAFELKARDFERCVVYTTEQVHHSADKALRIAGLGECIVKHIAVDERFRMKADELEKTIQVDQASHLLPWLIISSAGTTDTGSVDPLAQISDLAEKYGLWHHVDGAYGAFFMLCDELKNKFTGIERSDSLVMDPHKGLFLPYGSGAVIVKDAALLNRAHYYTANYMQDAGTLGQDELSPAELSPELTKHFRGLRMWLPLRLHGLEAFRACLMEKVALARYFYEEVAKIPGFETGPEPELSVCTYRYVPKNGDANDFNQKLINAMHNDGRVFISSTLIDGKFTLRFAALAFRTHLNTVDTLLEMLEEHSKELQSG